MYLPEQMIPNCEDEENGRKRKVGPPGQGAPVPPGQGGTGPLRQGATGPGLGVQHHDEQWVGPPPAKRQAPEVPGYFSFFWIQTCLFKGR